MQCVFLGQSEIFKNVSFIGKNILMRNTMLQKKAAVALQLVPTKSTMVIVSKNTIKLPEANFHAVF